MADHRPKGTRDVLFVCEPGSRRESFRALLESVAVNVEFVDSQHLADIEAHFCDYDIVLLDCPGDERDRDIVADVMLRMENVRGVPTTHVVAIRDEHDVLQAV